MSRFLLVVPPLVGHINPLAGVATELTRRGHRVAWCGHSERLRDLVGEQAEVYECAMPDGGDLVRPPGLTGPAAFRFLWEEFFLPLAEAMAPGVEAAVRSFAPDAVLTDQHALAGSLVSERLGVPYLTSASTSAELIDPLAELPKVAAWLTGRLAELRARVGDPRATADPRFSPYGILAFTSRELLGEAELPWERVHLVGPVIADRPEDPDFPWEDLDPDRDLVFVSLGTANTDAGLRFLGETAKALALLGDRVQGVFADPGGLLTEAPPGTLVRPHVPQLDLLSRAKAVVSHSGHNTVCETLWHGLPLVLAPIRDDQPIVARQVVEAGAGVRVRFGRVDAARLAEALRTVLDDTGGHRSRAAEIGRSLRATGGQRAAADHLEQLTARHPAPFAAH
ncbi:MULTISPECIES: glycosyltransferase [Streptomyces]|uniref:MGT family glycosyltransferase n=1 Tax=Streptomyces albus (strain ATCC 21838 / DSM 41398 / FERM P-419 / JCM 4703 / NBRC 107858) TaxID=1081613 RepID=A0A0B5F524_STRA4|nr:glycosyltransferase [Streptomyces sp. SCSIO ZS0520]AJE85467.1 MGT family glycosyltransferase [Streptomyces albus]AOU79770.1 MGT family glycosyltransferase [Streptomyces albus]AYN35494.1 glycosyl transferase [Streptomyces albus]